MKRTPLAVALVALCAGAHAATLISPVKVSFASGPAFPIGHRNGGRPDPTYAAKRAIDGNAATFCCLLDDTLTGNKSTTIPANAAAPVTGHMVFDLGKPLLVTGIKLFGRVAKAPMNPKNVDVFHYADDKPANNRVIDDIEHDADIKPLVRKHALPPLGDGKAATIAWNGVAARYIGLRVNASYESGGTHHNFQLGEVQFIVNAKPADLPKGTRIGSLYRRKPTLAATLLATRAAYAKWFPPGKGAAPATQAEGLWTQIRRDFPPASNPLLTYVHHEWFDPSGWFDRAGTTLERRLLERAAAEMGAAGNGLRKTLAALIQAKAAPTDPRWLGLCAQAAAQALVARETTSLRRAINDLAESFPARYSGKPLRARLDALEARLLATPADATLRTALAALKREALVTANPLLSPGKLLFVKRLTYSPGYYYAEFMRASRFGGNLCVLSLPDGKVTELVPKLAGGIFDRCDLSLDGTRIVFGYKAAKGKGFRIWEVGVDGKGLRQLTFDPPDEAARIRKYWHPRLKRSGVYQHHTDDFHPCYLPDGGIAFASTRCERGVLCGQDDSLSVNVLYRMNGDGSGMQCLSENALSESTPSVMNDGRILYTRWEYVDKGVIAVQALWTMRPDGTGTAEIYGNDIEEPPVLIHGRAVPHHPNLFVATATMHHPFAVGPILMLDINKPVDTHAPIRSLTPDTSLWVQGVGSFPRGESYTHLRNGRWVRDNIGPLFSEPYPLADPATGAGAGKYFLVDCNPGQSWNHPSAYGLWLIDTFGNRVLIHDDPKISCWQPMPLRSRPMPPIVPSSLPAPKAAPRTATVVLSDVYEGLKGVERGTVKYLRILEQVPRPWAARRFWPHDEAHGQHAIVSLYAHIYIKVHHGIVPVRPDGSAHFTVPADRDIFFQALDADLMEVQRMRTFVNFQPGETRACIGCHEGRQMAPPTKDILALRHPATPPGPQPGETVPRPIHYPTDVQPVLDRHCVCCHSGAKPKARLDLSATPTTYFTRSYENLFRRKLITYIQEFHGPQRRAQKSNVTPLAPRALGSHASKLITHLRKGHSKVKLSPAEWARLITWTDANGPFYGTYFGRRNIMYKDHPDFRPVPTLESAWGIAPKPSQARVPTR